MSLISVFKVMFPLALLLMAVSASADAVPTPKDLQVHLSSGDVLRGHFTDERHLKGFNGPMISEGHFVVAPDHGLLWAAEKPFVTTLIISRTGLLQQVGDQDVMKLSAAQTPLLLQLYDLLEGVIAGDWTALEAPFVVSRSRDAKGWTARLTPRELNNPSMPYTQITISGDQFVRTVMLLKADGDSDLITFSAQDVTGGPLSAAETKTFSVLEP